MVFENFHLLRPSSNAAATHARIAEILIMPPCTYLLSTVPSVNELVSLCLELY